jgi:hypothetical protein
MYPAFKHVEEHMRPTPVHLQVYDGIHIARTLSSCVAFLTLPFVLDIAHVLPVLFPFTTPGKYCYRAVALFCKHVTDAQPAPLTPADLNFSTSPAPLTPVNETPTLQVPSPRMHRSLSLRVQRAASSVKRRSSLWSRPSAQGNGEPAMNSVLSR